MSIPFEIFKKDIRQYFLENKIEVCVYNNNSVDVLVVTPSRMFNKRTSKLNKELGVHKVNKSKK